MQFDVNVYCSDVSGKTLPLGVCTQGETLSDGRMNMHWFDFMMKFDALFIGSPDCVAERIDKFRSELNCQHIAPWRNPGSVPYEKVRRGIELFAEKTIPQFDEPQALAVEAAR